VGLRLLCITAHPDDECFAFGGALALSAQRGIETSILCLTAGTAGSYRGAASSAEELGQLRRSEFAASCDILGVHHHEILDYQDGQLEHQTLSTLAADLVQRIRVLRPQVILTFGGDGALNTHADHTVTSSAATAAFHWAGSPKRFPTLGDLYTPQRLYYLTTDFFVEGRLRHIPAPWTHTLDVSSVLPLRMKAMKAHPTQAPLMERAGPLIFAKHGHTEHYALAAALVPQPATQSTDLFEGVAE
jgi:LmbE family N-acetylglucosaminyl deacetylase